MLREDLLDETTAELVRRIIRIYSLEQIWLFGSRARGDTHDDSDWDLLVIVPDDAPPDRRRSRLAFEATVGLDHGADVLVWPRAEFDARVPLRASLPRAVVDEGVLIHDAR